jgi:hypothetical protein
LPAGTDLDSESEVHGTACAEIIRDVAPDARIHLMRLGAGLWIEDAAQSATDLGCEVVSMSLAWLGYPENGAECDAIRAAAGRGLLWVNAAGNWQDRHTWETAAPVVDSNGWVEFAPGVRYNPVSAGQGVSIAFGFEAPNAGYARFEAQLYRQEYGNLVAVSTGNSDFYLQSIWASGPGLYFVAIRQVAPGAMGALRLQSFGNQFGYTTPEGSMSNPATVRESVSVGAVEQGAFGPGASPTSYSSTGGGPLALKLDLCGPTGCDTLSYNGSFIGTSCAAPNIAGLMALHLGWTATATAPLAAVRTLDVMAAGMDPFTGQGLARCAALDTSDAVCIASPAAGTVFLWNSRLPMTPVRFEGLGGSGTYTFSLCDGILPTGVCLDSATGWLGGTSMTAGSYEFRVRITDGAGHTCEADYCLELAMPGTLLITSPAPTSKVSANGGVQFAANGGNGALTWSVVGGMLPPGMAFGSDGCLSGTPRFGGEYGVTIRVSDSAGNQCSGVYQLSALGASPLPVAAGGQGGCAAGANAGAPLLALLLLAVTWARKRKNFPRTATPSNA